MKCNRNKYDYIMIIFILSISFGEIGHAFQPVRVLSIIFFPYLLSSLLAHKYSKFQIYCFYFLSSWLLFLILSLLWTPNFNKGVVELVAYICHFSAFVLLILISRKALAPSNSIITGWILFFVITSPFAIFELLFDIHLPFSNLADNAVINYGNGVVVNKKFSALAFYNMNTYITALCYSLPYILSIGLRKYSNKNQTFFLLLALSYLYLVLMNASRGGIVCSIAAFFCFLFYYKDVKYPSKKMWTFGSICLIFFFLFVYREVLFEQISYRLIESSLLEDTGRMELWGTAWKLILKSSFLGTGIGSINDSMAQYGLLITIPHNLFLEIFVQYGLLLIILFLIFIAIVFYKVKKSNKINQFIVYTSLIILPFSSIINSGYLLMPVFWLFLSSLYILSTSYK